MALTQIGYMGRTGPVFKDDTTVAGKNLVLIGLLQSDGTWKLYVKEQAFWAIVREYNAVGSADRLPIADADISMGTYQNGSYYGACPAFVVPPTTGANFDGYQNKTSLWTTVVNSTGTTTTTTPTTTVTNNGNGTTTTTTTSANGTTTSVTTPVSSAPTVTEQITTFFTNYWYVIVIVLLVLLWPYIGPALGLSKKPKKRFGR